MRISKNKVVTIDYTVTDTEGEVLDSTKGASPLSYIQGTDSIISGLERALEGKSPEERISLTIAPADGYGERDEMLVLSIPRAQFSGIEDLAVGMQLQMSDDAESKVVTVMEMDDEMVTVDGNHPLAGITLSFEVSVVAVRNATREELEHGHAHDGDHDHGDHDHGPGGGHAH